MSRALVALAAGVAACVAGAGCPAQVPVAGKTPAPPEEPPHFYADPPFGVGFDCVVIGCDTEKSLVVINKGGGKLGLSKIRVSVDTSTDFTLRRADGGPLPTHDNLVTLGGGEQLELLVRYRPSDGALDAGKVELEHFDGGVAFEDSTPKTETVPLTARAIGSPAAVVQSDVLDFGYVPVGSDAQLALTVENDGDAEVLSVGPARRDEGTGPVFHAPTPRDWGLRFANPGDAVSIPVVFSPPTADAFFGAVVLQTNDPAVPGVRIPVQGTAVADPRLAVVDPQGDLQMPPLRAGDSRTRTVTVRNLGGAPLDVTAAITAGADVGYSVDPPSVEGIAPLATATFNVTINGVASGLAEGTLTLTDAAGNAVDILAHAAVNAPALSVTPEPVNFGSVVQGWTAEPQAISLSNIGFGELTIDAISLDLGSSNQVQLVDVPTLPQKLAPGDPPIVVTVFMQAQNLGPVDAVMLVESDAIDDGVHRLNIHGDVITCEQGCPTPNGTPNCSSGRCEIGTCFDHFHDPNGQQSDGCECPEDVVGTTMNDIGQACPGLDIGTLHDGNGSGTRSTTRAGTLHAANDADLYFFRASDDGCFLCSDHYGAEVTLTGPPGMQLCANYQGSGNGCGGLPTNCRTVGSGPVTIRGNGQSGIFGSSDNSEDVTVFVLWGANAPPVCGSYSLLMRADANF